MNKYLTAPRASKDIPKGIPYIIGNEAAERFSFYGMKGILVVFMTKYLHILTRPLKTTFWISSPSELKLQSKPYSSSVQSATSHFSNYGLRP